MRSWFKHMHQKGDDVYGEPDAWAFEYPWEIIRMGFWMWAMSGFQKLPTQDEIMSYDPRYIDDMKLAHLLYSHQGNQSVPMQLLEQYDSFNQDPESFNLGTQLNRKQEQSDGAFFSGDINNRGSSRSRGRKR